MLENNHPEPLSERDALDERKLRAFIELCEGRVMFRDDTCSWHYYPRGVDIRKLEGEIRHFLARRDRIRTPLPSWSDPESDDYDPLRSIRSGGEIARRTLSLTSGAP